MKRAGRFRLFLRHFAVLAGVLLWVATSTNSVCAEPSLLPHRPWIAGFGSLCDAGPMVCTRIDEIGFNARIDAILLTSTDRRGVGLVVPYGFSFGILEHVEGGIYTHSAVWAQPDGVETHTQFQQGPMRFALKGLLWPWLPHPHQHFSLLLDFEYEARLPRFDGQNQLGLLTDLGALRAVANAPLGGVELGLSAGALFDWRGRYGSPELGARIGWHLLFVPDVKVFAEPVQQQQFSMKHVGTLDQPGENLVKMARGYSHGSRIPTSSAVSRRACQVASQRVPPAERQKSQARVTKGVFAPIPSPDVAIGTNFPIMCLRRREKNFHPSVNILDPTSRQV